MSKITKPRQKWLESQEAIVRKYYANATPQEMSALLDNVFDVRQISHKAKKMGIRKSKAYKNRYGLDQNGRMKKGHNSWNKGMRGLKMPGRACETQFKKGIIPQNYKPVGSTRVSVDGYVEIKIADPRTWVLMHREVWKQHHGEYPPPGTAIVFIDGNKQNCDINNLQLLTRQELMQRNSVHNLPKELKDVIRLTGVITRKINERTKQHQRSARRPI